MGNIRSSYYTDIGSEEYTFNNTGDVRLSEFRTGDLIFFSNRFPKSKVKRLAARLRGQLWDSCGVVIHAPAVFGDQLLIYEDAVIHPDDHLKCEFTMNTVHSGPRLVNLGMRLKSGTFEAIGVKKKVSNYRDSQMWGIFNNAAQQSKYVSDVWQAGKRTDAIKGPSALEVLKKMGAIRVQYADLTLNEMAGNTLNKYTGSPYSKIQVYVWPSKK